MVVSETVVILGAGTAVLAILFGIRVATRGLSGGTEVPQEPDNGATSALGGSGTPDVPGVIALPPLIFLGFLVVATVLEAVMPVPVPAGHRLIRYLAGGALAACGFALIAMGTQRLVAAGTNIPPILPTTALVVDGIYAWTRNPLYLGTTLVYLGLSLAAGSLWAILLAVPLLWVINEGVIAREERPYTAPYRLAACVAGTG
jgi:protein-S-isoprenylcysteine O-methyltransferase Ste14